MRRQAWILGVLLAVVGGSFSTAPAMATPKVLPTRFVDCGEVLNQPKSFKLGNDLDCTGGGFTVASAPNITIDLGGHLIRGDDAAGNQGDFGITIGSNSPGAKIKNGTIMSFDRGIETLNATNDRFTGLTIVDSEIDSIDLVGTGNLIADSVFSRGGSIFLADTNTATTQSDSNTIQNNTFYDDSVVAAAADNNVVANNTFFGGGINFSQGTDGSSGNVIDSNRIIANSGTSFAPGIVLSGDGSDDNQIINNVSEGNGQFAGDDGITTSDGDNTVISRNTTNGNRDNGIEVSGSATNATIDNNIVIGNRNSGIKLAGTATGAAINGNNSSNNGADGIVAAAGAAPDVGTTSPNTTNFNGFLNGLPAGDNLGIRSPDGTPLANGTNIANGNDVTTAGSPQCSGALCVAPTTPTNVPATLTTCGVVSVNLVLDNPLACPSGDALDIQTPNLTVDLGQMFVSSDVAAGVAISLTDGVAVSNGYVVGSPSGILFEGVTNSSLTGTVVSNTAGEGVSILPNGAVPSATNTLSQVVSVGSTADGLFVSQSDGNVFTSGVIAGSTVDGVSLVLSAGDASSGNKVKKSVIAGNGADGVLYLDGTHDTVSKNTLVGNLDDGVHILASSILADSNVVSGNTIRGNLHEGVHLTGTNAADGIGDVKNHVTKNTIQANGANGIHLEADPDATRNTIVGNKVRDNGGWNDGFGYGLFIESGTKTSVQDNVFKDNAADGVYSYDPTAEFVSFNSANHNGFIADNTATPIDQPQDNTVQGLGFLDVRGCGNKASGNDDKDQAVPHKVLKPCSHP